MYLIRYTVRSASPFSSNMMLASFLIIVLLALPSAVQSTCCRLPFTDGECRVNHQGPHRYQIMPNRRFGLVKESTECSINDFNSTYRKVVETKNYCNDCPGLLILHTNSSEIFLFPEYLDRILEGRTLLQRKNVVILTTALVGAYDLDFTLFAKHYAAHPVDKVPSIYVDLQLPPIDRTLEVQPSVRLRLPSNDEGKDGFSKISRHELISPVGISEQTMAHVHQLPYLYNFDIAKHHSSSSCNLYEVHVSPSSLVWTRLDSEDAACQHFMPFFGRNPCYATGFTRLFCSIVQNIDKDDALELSPYLQSNNTVEHLTLAVTGGRLVDLSLSNAQMRPATQVKILLLQGHLVVTDINQNLHIRVEYGSNCDDFSLAVPAGYSATRYRRFDSETLSMHEGDSFIDLPRCFRLIPNFTKKPSPLVDEVSDLVNGEPAEQEILSDDISDESHSNITSEGQDNPTGNYLYFWRNNSSLAYAIIILLILIALIPLCLGLFYRTYCNPNRKSHWTLNHSAQPNPAYQASKDERADLAVVSYADSGTQTKDNPIRI